ncbi:unnamed protein product [Pseudo-nitzschia multistriata]|uniref:Uncharacterized protein n=1 Tax=Pseudo-nitzschia multistriata TaxID=183589 RepID=A0A448ZT66_9STRA|nr:unnamed protein product [Pseudo-nitzschia multistriata]
MQLPPLLFTALSTLRYCKPRASFHPSSIAFSSSPKPTLSSHHSRLYSTSSNNYSSIMSDFKRAKLDDSVSTKVIGTHSGSFQADEAMGCFLLRQLPEYRLSKIVRSRDPKVLETCDIVIDVGGVYDHEKKRYDHHQRDYDERFDSGKEGLTDGRCTKLSASGLVYRHYGKEVIKAYYPNLSGEHLDLVYTKIYDSLLEALDAIDTGVEMSTTELVYRDTTGLSSRVARLNPRWNEVNENGEPPEYDERFMKASNLCGEDFLAVMTKIVESDLPAREVVEKAVLARLETDPSGEIICFPTGGLPWKGHLYELEKLHKVEPLIKFVLYTDQGGMWRVQAVTVEGKAFENRLSLPEEWRGVRDEDLEKLTNIKGCRFVHAAGFIGGNTYFEGALEMARIALQGSSK